MNYQYASKEEVYSAKKKVDSIIETWEETIPKEFDLSSIYETQRNWQTDNGRASLQNLKELLLQFNVKLKHSFDIEAEKKTEVRIEEGLVLK